MENQELSVEETEVFLQTVNKLLEEFRKIKEPLHKRWVICYN